MVGADKHNLKSVGREDPAGAVDVRHRRLRVREEYPAAGGAVPVAVAVAVSEACPERNPRLEGCRALNGVDALDKVIDIDQSPIGRTPRSNPATYTGLFTFIRDLFAGLPESRVRGYRAGRYSFNVKGGRCEACQGGGLLKIEMHFLPDVYVTCEACKGQRYNRETLDVRHKGKNIAEVLDMTVAEALDFFAHIPAIARKLHTLADVGLHYVKLGQSATTLSGGEAQRVKTQSRAVQAGHGPHPVPVG